MAEEGWDGAQDRHETGSFGHAGAAGDVGGMFVEVGGDAGVGWEGLVAELRFPSVPAEEEHGDEEDDC